MKLAVVVSLLAFCFAVEATYGPFVIGHRGASGELPENTMPAFARALAYKGIAGIETDLRLSKDGVVVLIHDATLNRTTNGTGDVVDFTVAELKQFSAGYPKVFGDKYPDYRIPTFREALELLLNSSNTIMVLDLKVEHLGQHIASDIAYVSAERNTTYLYDRVVASCWTDTQVADIGQYLNITVKQKLGNAPKKGEDTNKFFSDLLGRGVHAFSLAANTLSAQFISAAHLRMMPVVAWTPNNRSEVVPLIEMGVDGFITNEPGNVLGYVADFIAGKLPASDSDDKFSVSDLVWVALGSAGAGVVLGGVAVGAWAYYRSRTHHYTTINGHMA